MGNDATYVAHFRKYLENEHKHEIQNILSSEDRLSCYSMVVHMVDLLDVNPELAEALIKFPRPILHSFDKAAILAQESILSKCDETLKINLSVKKRTRIRLIIIGSAMDCPEIQPRIGRLGVSNEDVLLSIRGTVIRAGMIQMLEGERSFACDKCKFEFQVSPQVESRMAIELPPSCPSEKSPPCEGHKFTAVGQGTCCDYQELRIQEPVQNIGMGSVPRSISVILIDDIVDTVQPGEDVIVTGYLACRWKTPQQDARCDLEQVLMANNIQSRSEHRKALQLTREVVEQFEVYWKEHQHSPLSGRNGILEQICPQVHGLAPVKLAVALSLIGGVERRNDSGSKVRGECHLLLVGDPGVGKSQFLKYAAKLSPRAVLTTGQGSTSAGLTVTAVKQDGQWMLEAGALVLADGGVCCIDEFGSIREVDKAAILEAMEQQTISVAKAGLVTTLHTRATIFAVTNPKGHYDPDQSLAVNTGLSSPLLSRFDMVLVLRDVPDSHWDRIVSSHILSEHTVADTVDCEEDPYVHFWTMAMLQSYIRHVKETLQPALTPEAEQILVRYYQKQRRTGHENAARTTIRMLESLIRLAQAHARLMFRREVLLMDAVTAIWCVEYSMASGLSLEESRGNILHCTFPDDPQAEYEEQLRVVRALVK